MLKFIFWKVSLKEKAFIFMGVPLIAVVAVVIITGGVMAVVVVIGVAAAVVMAPRKGSGENPEKSFPWREGGLPLGFLMQKRARVGVISAPFNALPT